MLFKRNILNKHAVDSRIIFKVHIDNFNIYTFVYNINGDLLYYFTVVSLLLHNFLDKERAKFTDNNGNYIFFVVIEDLL